MKQQKQKLLVISVFLLLTTTAHAINIRLIQIQNLPDVENLMPDLEYILNHEDHLSTFISDEYWDYDTTKEQLTGRLIEIVTTLEQYGNTGENQDQTLLKGLIYSYLYNLDVQEYYPRAIEELKKIENYSYKDYRYRWFLGTIYAKSVKPYEAIEQFEFVESRVPEDKLHPLFWADYAEALTFAFMQRKSLETFEKYALYGNIDLDDNWFYQGIKEKEVQTTADMEISSDELYQLLEREKGLGYLCRALNIWIPAKGEWTPSLYGYSNHVAALSYKSQDIEDEKGDTITYSIVNMMYINRADVMEHYLSLAPDVKILENHEFDAKFTVLEIKDPEQYKHIGGAHGLVVLYEPETDERTGDLVEQPSRIRTRPGSGASYMAFQPVHRRIPEKISYAFLLDSCENIFEESKADFIEFMDKVIIE